eukprot:scaffold174351_cov29-Tisochrysis_lutea.AAC.6
MGGGRLRAIAWRRRAKGKANPILPQTAPLEIAQGMGKLSYLLQQRGQLGVLEREKGTTECRGIAPPWVTPKVG